MYSSNPSLSLRNSMKKKTNSIQENKNDDEDNDNDNDDE